METVNEVPPPVRIPVNCVRGGYERRQRRWLLFWVALAVAFGVIALVIYTSGLGREAREALAGLAVVLAILPLFPALMFVNSVLDWRRHQADQAARKFNELESALGTEQARSRLGLVLHRTGQLRKPPQFVGTTGDKSYLVISANARQSKKYRHGWVLEVDDEVTVLMARTVSVADIEAAFPELRFREAA